MKRITLQVLAVLGALMTAVAGLSGLAMYLFGGGRAAFDDPTIIWFAPLFLTPLALAGVGIVAVSSLVSRKKRALFGWSCLAFFLLLAATAASFMLTGLSSGEVAPEETLWSTVAIVLGVMYAVSMIVVSAVGVIVAREVHRTQPEPELPDVSQ